MSPTALRQGTWSLAFAARGFTARGTTWTRAPFRATREGAWLVLRAPAPAGELDLLASDAGWRGLWRLVPADGGALVRVFELPPTLVARIEHAPDELAAALATLDWALSSAESSDSGGEEPGWSPVLPAETVRSGALVARIRAGAGGVSTGLALPLTMRAPSRLGAGRSAWLRALLRDARSRWRLGRCLELDGVPSARIDLRGVPPEILEDMSAAALDALRQVGAWLLEPLDLVLDPSLSSPALDAGEPTPDRSPRRARPASTRRARPASSQETSDGSLDLDPS